MFNLHWTTMYFLSLNHNRLLSHKYNRHKVSSRQHFNIYTESYIFDSRSWQNHSYYQEPGTLNNVQQYSSAFTIGLAAHIFYSRKYRPNEFPGKQNSESGLSNMGNSQAIWDNVTYEWYLNARHSVHKCRLSMCHMTNCTWGITEIWKILYHCDVKPLEKKTNSWYNTTQSHSKINWDHISSEKYWHS
jgi:hypothetical protein